MRPLSIALLLVAGATGVACGRQTIVADLTPEAAQRCAVVLAVEGHTALVEADDAAPERRKVSIDGDDTDLAAARQALDAHGLPKSAPAGFSPESAGLIPTASEERARYIKGLSGEIETLVESVDGVESVEALVSLPERRPLASTPEAGATASVVVTHTGTTAPVSVADVREIVVRAVGSAITPDAVAVLLKPVIRRTDRASFTTYERDRVTEAGFVVTTLVLAAAQAATVWRLRSMRRRAISNAEVRHD